MKSYYFTLLISLLVFGCQITDEENNEFIDEDIVFINKKNPDLRVIRQSRCLTSSLLGATTIPSYEKRLIQRDFKTNKETLIDTSSMNKNEWIKLKVKKTTWSSNDQSYTEKEFFKEYYEKWTKESRLNFSQNGLKKFEYIDSTFLDNENKLFNNIYCYTDNTMKNSNYFNHIYVRHGNIVLQTISKDFYPIDKIKLFDEDISNEFQYKQTANFNDLNSFSITKNYNSLNDSVVIEVVTNYNISNEGEIIQLNNIEFETMNVIN